jgi:hypothetical protein
MTASTQVLLMSVALATATMVTIFGSPPLPAIIGGIGAGILLFASERIEKVRRASIRATCSAAARRRQVR